MDEKTSLPPVTAGQRIALAGAFGFALMLATYGAVGSYKTISDKAAQVGVPLPELVPIGIDGGLVGVVTLDLVLAWTANPVGWLRQLARLLAVGTVAANVSAGWPDATAIGLHAAAPMMLLAMVEAGRVVLLRHAGLKSGLTRDRIPFGRWVLSPCHTWLLWRRMVLWQITSYHSALEIEARLRLAQAQLRLHYGKKWKQKAPADLVWMLGTAPFTDEACSQISNVTGRRDEATAPTTSVPAKQERPVSVSHSKLSEVDAQLEEVLKLNERHWEQRRRPVSAETVRKQLRIGAARARELTWTVRTMDRTPVER